jgi:hypothetical protein
MARRRSRCLIHVEQACVVSGDGDLIAVDAGCGINGSPSDAEFTAFRSCSAPMITSRWNKILSVLG